MDRIFEILANLREKPDAAKQRVALFVSGILTLIIFIGWLFYFNVSAVSDDDSVVRESVGPFAAFQDGLSGSWNSIKSKFNLSGTVIYEKPVTDSVFVNNVEEEGGGGIDLNSATSTFDGSSESSFDQAGSSDLPTEN